jgi:hypothetical protein
MKLAPAAEDAPARHTPLPGSAAQPSARLQVWRAEERGWKLPAALGVMAGLAVSALLVLVLVYAVRAFVGTEERSGQEGAAQSAAADPQAADASAAASTGALELLTGSSQDTVHVGLMTVTVVDWAQAPASRGGSALAIRVLLDNTGAEPADAPRPVLVLTAQSGEVARADPVKDDQADAATRIQPFKHIERRWAFLIPSSARKAALECSVPDQPAVRISLPQPPRTDHASEAHRQLADYARSLAATRQ